MKTKIIILLLLITRMTISSYAQQKEVSVTYIGNEGFLIQTGGKKILIDALFGHQEWSWCVTPGTETVAAMTQSTGTFNAVDLIAATHAHADHMYPPYIREHLLNNPGGSFISGEQVNHYLQRDEKYSAITNRVHTITPPALSCSDTVIAGIGIRVYRIAHGPYWEDDPKTGKKVNRHSAIQNLGFLFDIDGVRIFHSGDANEECLEDFKQFRLDKENIDIAMMNGGFMWEVGCSGVDLMQKYVNADHMIMMHLNSDEYENYVSIADHYKEIFPSITIFKKIMETVTYIVK